MQEIAITYKQTNKKKKHVIFKVYSTQNHKYTMIFISKETQMHNDQHKNILRVHPHK